MLSWWWTSLRPWRGGLTLSLLILLGQILLTLTLVPLAGRLEPLLHQLELASFWKLLALIVGIYLGKQGLDYAQQLLLAHISTRWMLQARQHSFEQLIQADWQALQAQSPAESLTVLVDDLDKLRQALWSGLHQLLPGALTLLALSLVLFWICWPLSLALLFFLPLAARLLHLSGRFLHQQARQQQEAQTQIVQELNESVHNLSLIRLYRLSGLRSQRLAKAQQHWFQHRWQTLLWQHLERPLLSSMQIVLIALLLAFAAWLVARGSLSGADLLAFATALALAIDPGLWTAEALARLRVSRSSWQRLRKVQTLPRAQRAPWPASSSGRLEIQNLTCTLAEQPILKGLNLSLAPGEKVGLSAPSGSGKSTLLKILAGLQSYQEGQIALPKGWNPQDLLLIPQRAPLFQASLRENLCLGVTPTSETLTEILELCQLSSLIQKMPQGLDTVADARGNWLSGGEIQRLALARALLRQPRLLMLDEASSELDLETEAKILLALNERFPEMALILVSHRPQSLQQMERLWHIDTNTALQSPGPK